MAVSLKHTTQATGTDAGNGEIRKAQWNEEHTLTAAADTLLGAVTAGAVGEITCTAAGRALLDDANAAAQRTTLGLGSLATQSGTFSGTSSGTNTGDQNIFSTVSVSGQTDVVADSTADTLTLAAGSNITITTNATTDTVTIAAAASFPTGTRMLFQQSTTPTGWTKDTTAAYDNNALRIVTTSVLGSGGTVDFTTAFTSSRSVSVAVTGTTSTGTVGNTTLTSAQMPSHTHTYTGGLQSNTTATGGADRISNLTGSTASGTSGPTGGSTSHTHSLTMDAHTHGATGSVNLAVKYLDFIIGIKD